VVGPHPVLAALTARCPAGVLPPSRARAHPGRVSAPAFGVLLLPGVALARPEAVAEVGRAAVDLGYDSLWSTEPALLAHVGAALPLGLRSDAVPLPAAVPFDRAAVPAAHVAAARAAWSCREVLATTGEGLGADGRWLPLRGLTAPPRLFTVVHVLRPSSRELDRAAALGASEVVVALPGARELDALLSGFAWAAERLAQA
jgi:hypothetical protein